MKTLIPSKNFIIRPFAESDFDIWLDWIKTSDSQALCKDEYGREKFYCLNLRA